MSETAVLVIDMLNTYRHCDAEKLTTTVEKIIDPLTGLISAARNRGDTDVIYVNDNYGDFTAHHHDLVRSALDAYVRRFSIVVPPDAVAHIDAELGDAALKMMENNMRAEIANSTDCLG